MAEYRKRYGSDTWHWCRNCTNDPKGTPGKDYEVRYTKPTTGELDNQCRSKEQAGTCRT